MNHHTPTSTPSRPVPRRRGRHTLRLDRLASWVRTRVIGDHQSTTSRPARDRFTELVRAGYHIGPVPYGYQAIRVGDHTTRSRHRVLRPDPATARVVTTIFAWRVTHRLSLAAIATRLAAAPLRYPPPRTTAGRPRPWTVATVRAILTQPAYTGRTVWGRTRAGRPQPPHRWVTSPPGAHLALIDHLTFHRAGLTLAAPAAVRSRRRALNVSAPQQAGPR